MAGTIRRRGHPGPAALSAAAALAALLAACLLAASAPPYLVTLVVTVGLTALAASGLTLLLLAGLVSLGHAAFMGIGAYAAAVLARDHGVPTVLALAGGMAASMLAGTVVGAVTLGLRGHFLSLATLAIGVAASAAIVAAASVTGGASGLGQIPPLAIGPYSLTSERWYAAMVWAVVAVVAAGLARLMHSRKGRAIAALRTDPQLAEVFGVDAPRLRLAVFVGAAALAGLAGGLYAFYFRFLSPAPFGLTSSINILLACILGGAGHPFGAILGAVAVTGLQTLLQDTVARMLGLSGNVESIVFGAILVGVLLKWPGGLWSAVAGAWPGFTATRGAAPASLTPPAGTDGRDLLTVSQVSKRFGGLQALQDISFGVAPGEIVGLIGPNGAGKSTSFNVATGLLRPTEGRIQLLGEPPPARVSGLVSRGVSRTFQHVKVVPDMTVLENVAFGAYAQGRSGALAGMFGLDRADEARTLDLAWRALDVVELEPLATEPASRLSMGQARLLEVARALVCRPRLLLLDEPAAGLRTGEKLKLVTLLHRLKRAGTSVLLVEHDMDLVMNCVDRIVVLNRGRNLAAGLPDEIRRNPAVVSAYLGA